MAELVSQLSNLESRELVAFIYYMLIYVHSYGKGSVFERNHKKCYFLNEYIIDVIFFQLHATMSGELKRFKLKFINFILN